MSYHSEHLEPCYNMSLQTFDTNTEICTIDARKRDDRGHCKVNIIQLTCSNRSR